MLIPSPRWFDQLDFDPTAVWSVSVLGEGLCIPSGSHRVVVTDVKSEVVKAMALDVILHKCECVCVLGGGRHFL